MPVAAFSNFFSPWSYERFYPVFSFFAAIQRLTYDLNQSEKLLLCCLCTSRKNIIITKNPAHSLNKERKSRSTGSNKKGLISVKSTLSVLAYHSQLNDWKIRMNYQSLPHLALFACCQFLHQVAFFTSSIIFVNNTLLSSFIQCNNRF